jgi:uncharacterized protein YvpB
MEGKSLSWKQKHMLKRMFRTLTLAILLILLDVSAVRGNELPESAYISGVNGHPQKHQLSCESRSAADLAAYWGISLGENEFLGVLPRADNPEQGFVGSPDTVWGNIPPYGYGVHAGPVAATLKLFGLQAEAHNHLKWDDLRREVTASRPVIVWIIGQMWTGTAVEYRAPDGSTSIVAAYEHTMILTGYSRDTVQVVDAYTGQYQTYSLSSFLASWSVLGNMAVFASLAPPNLPVVQIESSNLTYIVQPGDYLTALANRYGTTWQQLAEINSISYPYAISVGQVLKLPEGSTMDAVTESTPVAPNVRVVNYETHLPLVQSDFGVRSNPVGVISPASQEINHQVSSPEERSVVPVCYTTGVDEALLVRLRKMLVPAQITSTDLLHK